ncbi:cell division cycle and apoptosis regulator protein 1-like [Galleria mellonella]|uniref:Cell division cycle and apoptosis regulator protein 1-like n=1 Tax=Galleria mellonella TaxID=7137 RepID=A0A6J1WLK7_GALME|nr:cell division cycle and apoptosis regulator protein 1-like [Galleria mellonella]
MQTGSGTKNPPWARSNVNTNMTGINPQIMDPNSMMTQQGMMPFQQTQAVFNPSMMQAQSGMAMPMAGQMPMNQMAQGQMYPGNVVAYPTPRAMNPSIYQNTQTNQNQPNAEQRVFTGIITKTYNDFGFVDHDVFYQTSVCAKGIIPKVNDRVLVEATYNPNMPFKWNATRVQVLPSVPSGPSQKSNPPKSNTYNAVPPPAKKSTVPRRDERPSRRDDRKRSRTRSRSRSRGRRDSRSRRDSPPRKRPIVHQPSPIKYIVRVPRIPLDIQKMDVPALSQRYTNLYIPSDFFNAHVKWGETFPPQTPFSLNNPCAYHILSKEIESPVPIDAVLEPPDADYRFSAKVMLISMPTLEFLYQKCGLTKVDDKDKRFMKTQLHPTRLIKFLVGQKGKGGENFAIGGPWSPSLDGENPQSDPRVLVKTAIRTCKALTGIDLSSCTQWYRVVEFYYWREGSGGNKSRLECVVLFLPDVWSAQPSRIEWSNIQDQYKAACDNALRKLDGKEPESVDKEAAQQSAAAEISNSADKSQIENTDADVSTITIDENDDEEEKPEPTHYSKIDLRTIKVDQLRQELRARNTSCKGLRAQLVSRLSKLIKAEQDKESKNEDVMELEDDDQVPDVEVQEEQIEINDDDKDESTADADHEANATIVIEDKNEENKTEREDKKQEREERKLEKEEKKPEERKTEKEIEEEKKKLEKEKQLLKSRYQIPTTPHIMVHPSASAKGGKFKCNVCTLSLLLDYRVTDNKEHSFELFVFAELFNEMLMRDFGFYIYKTLYTLPEKTDESKEGSEKPTDKKDDKKNENDKKEEKKDDKRDDKRDSERRDSRRRDRCESHSDDERSSSPRRRGRGVELPPDPYLLLSLVYFDTGRGGTISKKDLQNLFMSLGLALSRSQIRSLLEKVCIKEIFSYKNLVQVIKDISSGTSDGIQDLPLDGSVTAAEVPPQVAELEAAIAAGNRDLLPILNKPDENGTSANETKDISDTGVVVYKSRVVDVGALVAAEARGAAQRARLEAALESTRAQLRAARAAAAHTQQAERGAQTQLSDLTASLAAARARITSLTASSKIFHSALKSIQSKVEAVVNIKYEDDDVIEIVNGPTKEKEAKKETNEEKKEKSEATESTQKNEENIDSGETKRDSTEVTKEHDTKESKENDNIATENMEIDDKE